MPCYIPFNESETDANRGEACTESTRLSAEGVTLKRGKHSALKGGEGRIVIHKRWHTFAELAKLLQL
jgi:hypothetical protein